MVKNLEGLCSYVFQENYNEQVNIERTTGDRTIVFSGDDNEDMDMTYSHTVLINENPASNENPSSSKTGKVDFKDFLSRLNAGKQLNKPLFTECLPHIQNMWKPDHFSL